MKKMKMQSDDVDWSTLPPDPWTVEQMRWQDTPAIEDMPMTSDEQPSPQPSGMWEPDLKGIGDAIGIVMSDLMKEICARRMTHEYRRQQAEHGVVEVRRDDLGIAVMWATEGREDEGTPQDEAMKRLGQSYDAAAPEQPS